MIVTYSNEEKSSVYCAGELNITIPRDHRHWFFYRIDELEKSGEILPFEKIELEEESEASKRDREMESELTWTMIQRQYHETNDEKRMIYALDDLNKYAIQCRDHVIHDESGDLVIVGEIPKRPEPIK